MSIEPRSGAYRIIRLVKRTGIAFAGCLWLLAVAGCMTKQDTPHSNSQDSASGAQLDTGRIEKAVRAQALLPASEKEHALRKILSEAIAVGYNDRTCRVLMDIGEHHTDHGNLDSTLYYFQRAKDYCNKPIYDSTLPAAYLIEFGAFYHSLRSDHVAANSSYYQALNYLKANKLTENELTILVYIYLLGTQEILGHHAQALTYIKEAEKLAIKLDSKKALIAVRTNLGDYYYEQKDYQTAARYYDLALADIETSWDNNWDPNILIGALAGRASAYTAAGEPLRALPLLQRAMQIARDYSILFSQVSVSIEIGAAYNKLRRFNETIALVAPVVSIQEESFSWRKDEGYETLMEAYEGLGQYKQALDYQRKLQKLSDSLLNVEKATAMNELEVKYQTATKDKEIAAKRLQIEQQKNSLARQKTLIGGLSLTALMAVTVIILLYRTASQRQKVQELQIKTLQREQEINLLKATIQGEEQERKRLSRELHDGIGSMIFSAIMRVSMLKKKEPKAVTSADFDEILHFLEQTGGEVRKTAHNMMPDIISGQSLFEAVQTYCENIAQGTSVKIDVQFYGDGDSLPPDIKLVVYRIIQELVHNVVKHSKATQAIVQGVLNEQNFTITVEDNGKGFDTSKSHKGMGLKNLEERIKSLHGEFEIESKPGKGTTVYMEFDRRQLGYSAASD